jgi:hypothetical protein
MLALVKGNVVGVEAAMIGRAHNDVRTSAKVSQLPPQPSIHSCANPPLFALIGVTRQRTPDECCYTALPDPELRDAGELLQILARNSADAVDIYGTPSHAAFPWNDPILCSSVPAQEVHICELLPRSPESSELYIVKLLGIPAARLGSREDTR